MKSHLSVMAGARLAAFFLNKVSLTISLFSCMVLVYSLGLTCHCVEIMEMSCCDFTVCSVYPVRVVILLLPQRLIILGFTVSVQHSSISTEKTNFCIEHLLNSQTMQQLSTYKYMHVSTLPFPKTNSSPVAQCHNTVLLSW